MHLLETPGVLRRVELELSPDMQRVHQLAIDVDLQLVVGAVADAHRLRFLVALQPVERSSR